jgi:hypothetical protein
MKKEYHCEEEPKGAIEEGKDSDPQSGKPTETDHRVRSRGSQQPLLHFE